jgi:GNAT superfamily N-acetyltransferase
MPWQVVPYTMGDLPAISHFFKKNYPGPGTYGTMDLFYWKIAANYIRPGIINLVKDKERIVSTTSVTPKRLLYKKKEIIVAEIGDTYTDPEYQRQGMFSLLINQSTQDALKADIPFIYGTPNNQSLPGYEKKAGYHIIPGMKVKLLALPLNIRPLVQKRCHWLIGALASFLFSSVIFIYFLAKKIWMRPAVLQVEEWDHLPDKWDEFWEKTQRPYDLIFCRDRKALEWRFFENPNKYRFYAFMERNDIVGYLVYRVIHDSGRTILVIADFLCLPSHEKKLNTLLFKVLDDAFKAGITIINIWCPESSPYFQVFKKLGFIVRDKIPIICFQNDFSRNLQQNPLFWHFTVSDSDNI